jgi:hypothetical protein
MGWFLATRTHVRTIQPSAPLGHPPCLNEMTDSRIGKWRRWLEDEIQPEVMTINLHRFVFREVGDIIDRAGSLPPSYWFEFSSETYATTQAVAIRRQAEVSTRVVSLGRLIAEIRDDAKRLSRAWWVGLWTDPDPIQDHFANNGFTKQYAPGGGDHLDPAIPEADLAHLTSVAESVKRYVDQHVAHNDASPRGDLPTFDDLNASIDVIGELFGKYGNLLTAASWVTVVPVMQHDWQAIFRQPWLRS